MGSSTDRQLVTCCCAATQILCSCNRELFGGGKVGEAKIFSVDRPGRSEEEKIACVYRARQELGIKSGLLIGSWLRFQIITV